LFKNKTPQTAPAARCGNPKRGRARSAAARVRHPAWALIAILAIVCWSLCAAAPAAEDPSGSAAAGEADNSTDEETPKRAQRWKIEVKRQSTDRGTDGESSNTKLRFEAYPTGPVSMLRLDLPFPDDRSDFLGSPFNPRLGDIKVRAKTAALDAGGLPLSTFLELTFPTADPESLGQGKYVVTAGVDTSWPLGSFSLGSTSHKVSVAPLIQQVVSVAGDQSRKDINYTKLELALRDVWRNYALKLTLKPVIDWEQDGATGAVTELEGRMSFGRGWATALMIGHRTWGGSVPSTYGTRVELTLGRTF
jgi:hypothetical protein